MLIFSLGGVDLSKNILVPTYKVNAQPVYMEWTDGNDKIHREISRYRIAGNFKMKFFNKTQYLNTLRLFREQQNDEGYTTVSVYVNNLDEVKVIDAYITMDPANDMPLYGNSDYDGFDVNIKER